ncbi:MAG TPA: glycosyltransferase family 39 protein, partial [Anaerolineae bacterium]|nr:glycosyltransferase family 39 protein [Anaerolineae bacterium]
MRTRDWATAHRAGLIITAALILFGLALWHISPPPDIWPPLETDLAFDSLMGLRRFMLEQSAHSQAILLVGGAAALCVIWLIALIRRRARQAVSASLAIASALVALQAQVYLMRGQPTEGGTLYLIAAAIFLVWAMTTRRAAPPVNPPTGRLSRRAEMIALTIVLSVSVFARVYDLKRLPYGIDGDESKWTIEVVSTVSDGRDILSSEYHRRQLPISFLMEAPFQWLIGPGLTPGRVGAAIYSIVATAIFYRLVRRLTDAPTALTATWLLAVSLPDITASRAGNVESYARLWSILPLFGLATALDTRDVRHFFWTGAALAGAMLTYETLMPTVAATLTLAMGAAWRDRRDGRAWLRRLAALATAPAAVAIVNIDYLLGRMQYYQSYRSQAQDYPFGEQLLRGVEGLLRPFYSAPLTDALFNRQGPYINGLLVPLLALGLIYAIADVWRRGNAFALTWLAWAFIPIPVILHTPLPRILYPGAPVLYLLIAVALAAIFRTVNQAVRLPKVTALIGALMLSGFALLNLTIWFQEIKDTPDEVRRRQVSEIVAAVVDPAGLLLMPHFPFSEPVDIERELMALIIRERRGTSDAGEYRAVLFEDLLPTLSREGPQYERASVLYDITQHEFDDRRQAVMSTLLHCYPGTRITSADAFDLYQIDAGNLARPACRIARLTITPPPPVIEGGAGTTISVAWSLDSFSAAQSRLSCWRSRPDVTWIEVETFGDRAGWIADTQFASGWSGLGYLADNPDSAYAATTIEAPGHGMYRVWVRSLRRQDDAFPAFMEIGDQTLVFGEPDAGT